MPDNSIFEQALIMSDEVDTQCDLTIQSTADCACPVCSYVRAMMEAMKDEVKTKRVTLANEVLIDPQGCGRDVSIGHFAIMNSYKTVGEMLVDLCDKAHEAYTILKTDIFDGAIAVTGRTVEEAMENAKAKFAEMSIGVDKPSKDMN